MFERIVYAQITKFILENNKLDPCHQSDFRGDFSTQTALLRVCYNIRGAVGNGCLTCLTSLLEQIIEIYRI